jgi:hypothetical protein
MKLLSAGLLTVLATPATGQTVARLADPCPAPAAVAATPSAPTTTADTLSLAPLRQTQPLTEAPDVVLFASLSAREVRFDRPPRDIRVRLCWGSDSLRVVQRRNLPSPVQAGVSYRDVSVAVEILGRINAECLLASLRSADQTQPDFCAAASVTGQRR